ncbi:MAG TPA: NAD(P)H-binding protein [Thermoanaerobaculia bacterium]|nr:NAD(P)H-binding protein [Thermoanaerobaculia bacterium]
MGDVQRQPREVFITGATGYLGRDLVPILALRGHRVRALVRPGSEWKVPPGCTMVKADPLIGELFRDAIHPGDTFIQLVGTPKPAPWKGRQFLEVDLASARESVMMAAEVGVAHFIYVSVAQPAPVMKSYIAVRQEVERMIRASGLPATILRPWYVVGPFHRWPLLFSPVYRLLERLPETRETARRLALVTLPQMHAALVAAVEDPATELRIVDVAAIRATPLPPELLSSPAR